MKTRTVDEIFSTMAPPPMVWLGPTIAFAANNQEQVAFSRAATGAFGGIEVTVAFRIRFMNTEGGYTDTAVMAAIGPG